MASKADWERQRRLDERRDYAAGFLEKLERVTSVADAYKLASHNIAPPDSPGRLVHTNLLFFLDSIREGLPRFPAGGSRGECLAYVGLAKRLHGNGQLTADTVTVIERQQLPLM